MSLCMRLAVLMLSACLTSSSFAGFKVLMSPPRMELKLVPGEAITKVIKVRNDFPTRARIRSRSRDWYHDTEGKVHYQRPGDVERSAADWILVNPREFEIPPYETYSVRLTASLPEEAEGTYWTSLSFETIPESSAGQIGMSTRARLICYIYLTCIGTERERAELTDFTSEEVNGETIVKVTVKNTGNVHLRPDGKVSVEHDGQSPVVQEFQIRDLVVLPYSSRTYAFNAGPLSGLCETRAVMDY